MSIISDLILVGPSAVFGAASAELKAAIKKISQQKTMKNFKKTLQNLSGKIGRKRLTFLILICLGVIFLILQAPQALDRKEVLEFNRDLSNYNVKLQILDHDKKLAEFLVAIANDDNKKMYGLMNLKHLPKEYGMLFPFSNQVAVMWMKNTKIPLDMIFIDKNNVIVTIKTNAVPESLDLISSEVEVTKALEINAGEVQRHGIKVGQKVRF
jgi:hypothetical protein